VWKTIFGLILLVAELLKPKQEALPAKPRRRTSPLRALLRWTKAADFWLVQWLWPWVEHVLPRLMSAAETTTLALLVALTLPLVELWAHAMANVYAHDFEDRCGAIAMANFAATAIPTYLVAAFFFRIVSTFLRWLSLPARLFALFLRIAWLWVGLAFFGQAVFFGQLYIEYLPALPAQGDLSACRELISGPTDIISRLLRRHLFPKGPVGAPLFQKASPSP
jgi:hypothetical protein